MAADTAKDITPADIYSQDKDKCGEGNCSRRICVESGGYTNAFLSDFIIYCLILLFQQL